MDVMFKSSFIQEKTWIKTLGFQNLSGPLQPTVVIFEKRSINIFSFLLDPSVIQKWGWMRFVEEWIIHSSLSFAWKPTASENPFINILQVENAQIVQQSWHDHCSEYPLCSITIYQKLTPSVIIHGFAYTTNWQVKRNNGNAMTCIWMVNKSSQLTSTS